MSYLASGSLSPQRIFDLARCLGYGASVVRRSECLQMPVEASLNSKAILHILPYILTLTYWLKKTKLLWWSWGSDRNLRVWSYLGPPIWWNLQYMNLSKNRNQHREVLELRGGIQIVVDDRCLFPWHWAAIGAVTANHEDTAWHRCCHEATKIAKHWLHSDFIDYMMIHLRKQDRGLMGKPWKATGLWCHHLTACTAQHLFSPKAYHHVWVRFVAEESTEILWQLRDSVTAFRLGRSLRGTEYFT